jgi:uncharacterized protein (DUF305 family)
MLLAAKSQSGPASVPYSGLMNKTSPKAAFAGALLTLSLTLTGCAATDATHDMGTHDSSLTEAAAFAQMMIPHHLQAITMAAYAKDNGKDPKVIELAKQIYTSQAAEIDTMKTWLGDTKVPSNSMTEGMLSEAEMKTLNETKGEAFDQMFLEAMTAHHAGSLEMATAFQKTQDPELKKVVTEILSMQTIEISMMKLLKK